MYGFEFLSFGWLSHTSPQPCVVVEECLQRGQRVDLVAFSDGTLIGVDQSQREAYRVGAVMCEIHLTCYRFAGTVIVVRENTPYAKEAVAMLISTSNALKLHEHRINELRQSAEKARLTAGLASKSRSFALGNYRLTLAKEPEAHVPRMV